MFALILGTLLWAQIGPSPSGNLMVQGDPDEWVIAERSDGEQVSSTVLLRPGESVASWYEMLTFMELKGQALPRVVANNLRDRLLANCPQSRFEFHHERPDDVLYEFQSAGCNASYGHASQHEIGRIIRRPNGALRVAYAVNSPQMSPELRRRWTTLLEGRLATTDPASVRIAGGGASAASAQASATLQSASEAIRRLNDSQEALLAELDQLGAEAREDAARYAGRAPSTSAGAGLRQVSLHEIRGDGAPGIPLSEFKSTDTGMWALMPLSARSGADVRVRWIYEGGEAGGEQLVREFSMVWDPTYDTVRSLLQFNRLIPVGRYRVEVVVDGLTVGVGRFSVRRAGQFG
jgi:hypothetical protein